MAQKVSPPCREDDYNEETFIQLMRQWYRECRDQRSGYGSVRVEMVNYGAILQIEETYKTRVTNSPSS